MIPAFSEDATICRSDRLYLGSVNTGFNGIIFDGF
jgi:tetrahydromethanopterin S-methyltransferase subunit F